MEQSKLVAYYFHPSGNPVFAYTAESVGGGIGRVMSARDASFD
jgi:hypothetical protein